MARNPSSGGDAHGGAVVLRTSKRAESEPVTVTSEESLVGSSKSRHFHVRLW